MTDTLLIDKRPQPKGEKRMRRPVHFEIHAEDPERAANFYSQLFGWEITKWDGPVDYWLVSTGSEPPGIEGAILRRMGTNPDPQEPTPVIAYVCTIDVENVDEMIDKVGKLGGVEALGKTEVPGVGWQVYYKDTESNVFGMMQAMTQPEMT
jgi:uncharacterized protein